jgi:predicted transcriptional regulator of viral defense system
MTSKTSRERALELASRRPIVAGRDLAVHGQELTRLVRGGALERVARGIYRIADRPISEHHALALVAATAPRAVICLLSAVSFHGIGTQRPFEVWVAIQRGTRPPTLRNTPLRVVRMGSDSFGAVIEVHRIEGQPVRVFSAAKTIADLFKFRNRIGIGVAVEALRDAWQRRLVTMDAIERYARLSRVDRVMKPYIEALVA